MRSNFMPASSKALIAPIWAAPLMPPPERQSPNFKLHHLKNYMSKKIRIYRGNIEFFLWLGYNDFVRDGYNKTEKQRSVEND